VNPSGTGGDRWCCQELRFKGWIRAIHQLKEPLDEADDYENAAKADGKRQNSRMAE
jgi:hypothetical protein